jgi:predicted nuclease with TOPRIM domain
MARSLQQARQELRTVPLANEVRRQRERALDKLVRKYAKDFQKNYNDRLERAKEGYQAVNEAQDELDDEYEELAAQEGRLSVAEYQKRLESLNQQQARLEQQRQRYDGELARVGELIDRLEEEPEAVIDERFDKYPALPRPEIPWDSEPTSAASAGQVW